MRIRCRSSAPSCEGMSDDFEARPVQCSRRCLRFAAPAAAAGPTDPQIAHIAYTAGNIDIAAGKQALAKSHNKTVRSFAQEMVRDHTAVNDKALALVKKLHVTPRGQSDQRKASPRQADAERAKLGQAQRRGLRPRLYRQRGRLSQDRQRRARIDADPRRQERRAQVAARDRPHPVPRASGACRAGREGAEMTCARGVAPCRRERRGPAAVVAPAGSSGPAHLHGGDRQDEVRPAAGAAAQGRHDRLGQPRLPAALGDRGRPQLRRRPARRTRRGRSCSTKPARSRSSAAIIRACAAFCRSSEHESMAARTSTAVDYRRAGRRRARAPLRRARRRRDPASSSPPTTSGCSAPRGASSRTAPRPRKRSRRPICRHSPTSAAFEGRSSLSTWLTRIVVNEALGRRRSEERRRRQLEQEGVAVLDDYREALMRGSEADAPDVAVAREQIRKLLEQAVADLARHVPHRVRAARDRRPEQRGDRRRSSTFRSPP